jgi:hypothetical protein
MNWGNLAGNVGGGAAAGSAFGPWGTAAGAGLGLMQSFMGDPNEAAEDASKKGWEEAQNYEKPYWQQGQDQYGRLNQASQDLMSPELLDKWSSNYETSPYAQRLLNQNKSSGLDAASSMGLMGSSAAMGNIQTGAGDVVAKDRQQYLENMMKNYMAGIGLSQNIYGTGATMAGTLGGQATGQGQDMANLEYKRVNDPQQNLAKGLASGVNAFNQPNKWNSTNIPQYAQNAMYS